MNKKDTNKVLRRLKKMRSLIDEVTEILQTDYNANEESANTATQSSRSPGNKSLEKAWSKLKKELGSSQHPEALLEKFFKDKTKKEIQDLARANALPVDTKAAKKRQIEQLVQLLKVNRAIEGM